MVILIITIEHLTIDIIIKHQIQYLLKREDYLHPLKKE